MRFNFKDARWNVTNSGLEAISPDGETYPIDRHRLLEVDRDGYIPLYVCPLRMSRQLGIDIDAFLEALTQAIKVHRLTPDRRILDASIRVARADAQHSKQMRWNEENFASWDLPTAPAPEYRTLDAPEPPAMDAPVPPHEKQVDGDEG
jgi:hypothetical protein